MAREAFQSELISEHVDCWEFDTKLTLQPLKYKSVGGKKEILKVDSKVLEEFHSLFRAIGSVVISLVVVYGLHDLFC
jgi:hypothetical protein